MNNDSKFVCNQMDSQYIPFFLEYTLMGEYQLLQNQNINGVYVMPSARTPLVWFGVIFVRQGLYQGGVFRFCIIIPHSYPNGECPQVIFDQPPYHPLVDEKSGVLYLKQAFPKWKRDVHRIYNLLSFVRRIFYKINSENYVNSEAAILYKTKLVDFKNKVEESINSSKLQLEDPPKTNDPYELVFNSNEQSLLETRKIAMISSLSKHQTPHLPSHLKGLSWVVKGTTYPFGKN